MLTSKFRIYSLGRAVEDKAIDSYDLLIHPIEILPMVDGVMTGATQKFQSAGVDGQGIEYTEAIQTSICITAEWYGADYRRTAPDIRRGEQVMILQYANEDRYYWISNGRNSNLRRLETVLWCWSDIPDLNSDEVQTLENSYWLEVCTRKGIIQLQTSQRNGEKAKFSLSIDSKNGLFKLNDQKGNSISLDSVNNILKLINANGSHITLDKGNIIASTVNTNWSSETTHEGNVTILGNLAVSGDTAIGGAGTCDGGMTAPTFTGDLKGNADTATYAERAGEADDN